MQVSSHKEPHQQISLLTIIWFHLHRFVCSFDMVLQQRKFVCSIRSRLSHLLLQAISSSQKIFLINCLVSIQQPLSDSGIDNEYIASLRSKIQGYLSGLVDEEVVAVLEKCKLQKKVSYIQERLQKHHKSEIVAKEDEVDEENPLAQLEDMGPAAFAESIRMFVSLVIGSEGVVPEFQQLQNPQLRSEASTGVAKSLSQAYEAVYTALLEPINGYPDPRSILRHTPEQIKTILGI